MITFYNAATDAVLGTVRLVNGELVADPGAEDFLTAKWRGRESDFMDFYADWSNGYIRSKAGEQVSLFYNKYHDARGRFAASPAGSVMKPDGGFTFDPVKGKTVSSGYAVSPYPERSKVVDVDNMSAKQVRGAINDYVAENMDLAEKSDHYVGGWRDPQPGGKVYLDVSIVVPDKDAAIQIAKDKDQIAVFDFQTFQSIQVDAKAKSGQAEPKKILGPTNAEKIRNAATMFGTNSPQHRKAKKLFGGK